MAEETPTDRVLTKGGEAPDADKAADRLDSPPPGGFKADSKARKSDLLDEALEETFPASDPVAAKHIT